MGENRKTVARDRSRGNRLVGNYPRSIEILLKKATLDSVFKENTNERYEYGCRSDRSGTGAAAGVFDAPKLLSIRIPALSSC